MGLFSKGVVLIVAAPKAAVEYLGRAMVLPALLALGLLASAAELAVAQTPDLIPASPVPIEDYVAEGNTKMGVIVGAVVGVWFVYMLVKKGLKWARSAF